VNRVTYLERSGDRNSLYGSCGSHLALGRTPGTETQQYQYSRDINNNKGIIKLLYILSHSLTEMCSQNSRQLLGNGRYTKEKWRRMPSYGMRRSVALVRTDVSEDH
jgi:hypothetical protein